MARALEENAVIVAQMQPFFDGENLNSDDDETVDPLPRGADFRRAPFGRITPFSRASAALSLPQITRRGRDKNEQEFHQT